MSFRYRDYDPLKIQAQFLRSFQTNLILRILYGVLSEELQLCQLKELIGIGNGVKCSAQIFERLLVADGHERRERIAFAGAVCFRLKERLNQFGGIRNEGFGVLEDRRHSPNSILSNIGVAVV